jgi:DNA-binding transcriptional MerR regulator
MGPAAAMQVERHIVGASRKRSHGAAQASRRGSVGAIRASRERSHGPAMEPPDTGAHAKVVYPIGALAKIAGVSTRTVRYYEEIRLLETARRFSGGRRVFGRDALERLRFIGRLKRLGFTLNEIRHLNEVFSLQRSTAQMLQVLDGQLARHLAQLDERLRELTALRGDLGSYRRHIRERLAGLAVRAAERLREAQTTQPRGSNSSVRALGRGSNSSVRALGRGSNSTAARRKQRL